MTDVLTVRLYNVRFGDAILVTVPDRDPQTKKTTIRRILIDVGNVKAGEGGEDAVFKPVIDDILAQLDGDPLDLYVMTHEHLDHVQGLPYAAWKLYSEQEILGRLQARHVWLTASAAPDYYDRFEDAKRKRLEALAALERISRHLAARPPEVQQLYAAYVRNNDPQQTAKCVDFLRKLNPRRTTYAHRSVSLRGAHPFKEAKLEIWAPEEDTSDYYGRFVPLFLGPEGGPGVAAVTEVFPPAGVDLGAFLGLVEARRSGIADNLLAIDQAGNNTSIVFLLEWRGWRLLFPGDAEIRSWQTMHREGVLKPVHFLKVAHHGSHNGTPSGEAFDAILPGRPSGKRLRTSAISTWDRTYSGIPHGPTNQRLQSRTKLRSTLDDKDQLYLEVKFNG